MFINILFRRSFRSPPLACSLHSTCSFIRGVHHDDHLLLFLLREPLAIRHFCRRFLSLDIIYYESSPFIATRNDGGRKNCRPRINSQFYSSSAAVGMDDPNISTAWSSETNCSEWGKMEGGGLCQQAMERRWTDGLQFFLATLFVMRSSHLLPRRLSLSLSRRLVIGEFFYLRIITVISHLLAHFEKWEHWH